MKPLSKKKLDSLITQLYYKNGEGVRIDVMDIGKIFEAGRKAHADAKEVEPAIIDAIARYRKN